MLKEDKKGVSPIIGYVLLVIGVLVVSVIVYSWLQTYLPRENAECPEEVSLDISLFNCTINSSKVELRLSLINKGLFNVDGFFIRGTNDSEQTLANIDLIQYLRGRSEEAQIELFNDGRSPLKPGEERGYIFNIDDLGNLSLIEVIPAKFEIVDGKKRFTSCSNSAITQKINCQGV